MRKVTEIRNEIAGISLNLGSEEIQLLGTKKLKEQVAGSKTLEELQYIIMEVLKQDEYNHEENIKKLKEKAIILDDELKQSLKEKDIPKTP